MWAVAEKRSHDWDHTCELLANQINIAAKKHITTAQRLHPTKHQADTSRGLTLADLADFVEP